MSHQDEWKSLIRALIYPIQFEKNALDGVDRVMKTIISKHALGARELEYEKAIETGLTSKEPLALLIPQPHSEDAIRNFLKEISRHLRKSTGQ